MGLIYRPGGVDGLAVFEVCNDSESTIDEGVKKLIEKCMKARLLHDAVSERKDRDKIGRFIVEEVSIFKSFASFNASH
jgi:hypothetical protein